MFLLKFKLVLGGIFLLDSYFLMIQVRKKIKTNDTINHDTTEIFLKLVNLFQ